MISHWMGNFLFAFRYGRTFDSPLSRLINFVYYSAFSRPPIRRVSERWNPCWYILNFHIDLARRLLSFRDKDPAPSRFHDVDNWHISNMD